MEILKFYDDIYGGNTEIRGLVEDLDAFVAASDFKSIGLIPTTNPNIEPVKAEGATPSTPSATSDGKVEPIGVPLPAAVLQKITTEKQARFFNLFLHVLWKEALMRNDIATQKKIETVHAALAEKMKASNWYHLYLDDLDNTLPSHLKVVIGPVDEKISTPSMPKENIEKTPVTIGVPKVDSEVMSNMFSSMKNEEPRFISSLPQIEIGQDSSEKLSKEEALRLLSHDGNAEQFVDLPENALYLLLDVVEEGIFNNVEILKSEMELASHGYAGRMFIEGHDWNNPEKAIGQILKAFVYFNERSKKYTLRVLSVVLKPRAIEAFNLGLYKFVSIGASMVAKCCICGLSVPEGCRHKRGVFYDTPRGRIKCFFIGREMSLEELSVVNVPACRPASAVGRVSIDKAREMLAASLSGGSSLGELDEMFALHEVVYSKENINENIQEKNQTQGENLMSKWQENFRVGDTKGYMALLAKTEENAQLNSIFADMRAKRKIVVSDLDTLTFVHELLHRWFNTPTRAKTWSEEEIIASHDEIVKAMMALKVEHKTVSIMDDALHSESELFGKLKQESSQSAGVKIDKEKGDKEDKGLEPTVKIEINTGGDDEDEDDEDKTNNEQDEVVKPKIEPDNDENKIKEIKYKKDKLEILPKSEKKSKLLNTDGAKEPENASETKVVTGGVKTNGDVAACGEDLESCNKGNGKGKVVVSDKSSLKDSFERRAGYLDGVATAKAGVGGTIKDVTNGGEVVKSNDYREGYKKGYKQPSKGKNHLKEQIKKGGIHMVNTEQGTPVVAVDIEKMAALQDVGNNEEQGQLKAEKKVNVEKVVKEDKLGDVNIVASDKQTKDKMKVGVKEVPLKKGADAYGYIKCPSCLQDNIMPDSKKCPRCGHDLTSVERKGMEDFPIQKTQTAYDTPPLAAKVEKPSDTPALKKLAAEKDESVTMAEELKLVKQHLTHLDERSENERAAWSAERTELLAAKEQALQTVVALEAERDALQLDLQTKNAMFKTATEENKILMDKLAKFVEAEKADIVNTIVNTKLSLGLLKDVDVDAQIEKYSERSIETLRVILTEVVDNANTMAKAKVVEKFGVPVAETETAETAETTETLASNDKEGVVEKESDAVLLAKAEADAASETEEPQTGVKTSVAEVGSNSVFGKILHSLGKK